MLVQGRGVGSALLREAELWANKRQHRLLTLNVFTDKQRARKLYECMGFLPETIRLLKALRSPGA